MSNFLLYVPIDEDDLLRIQMISFRNGYRWRGDTTTLKYGIECFLFDSDTKYILYSDIGLESVINYCKGNGYNYKVIENINKLKIELIGGVNYNSHKQLIYD